MRGSYALLAKDITTYPISTGQNVVLPYFRGCLYVAYKAEDTNPVS